MNDLLRRHLHIHEISMAKNMNMDMNMMKTQEAQANFVLVKPLHFPNGTIPLPLLCVKK